MSGMELFDIPIMPDYHLPSSDPTIVWGDPFGDLAVWARYKASRMTSLVDGSAVSQWNDISGNNRHATQANSLNQPTLRAGITGLVGNIWGVDFQGNDTNPQYLQLPSMASLTQGEIFIFFKLNSDPPISGGNAMMIMGSGDSPAQFSVYPFSDGVIYDSFGSTARKTTVNPTPTMVVWRNYNASSLTGNWTNRLDNVQLFTTGTNTVGFQSSPLIGGYPSGGAGFKCMHGQIAEIVILSTVTSSGKRTEIADYFNREYLGL